MIHKYLFWADRKIHSVFFIENKDDIYEDLLIDFKNEDNVDTFKKSEQYGTKKMGGYQNGEQVKQQTKKVIEVDRSKKIITKEDLLFGNETRAKKKVVDINDDEDFPTLGDDMPS